MKRLLSCPDGDERVGVDTGGNSGWGRHGADRDFRLRIMGDIVTLGVDTAIHSIMGAQSKPEEAADQTAWRSRVGVDTIGSSGLRATGAGVVRGCRLHKESTSCYTATAALGRQGWAWP